MKKFFLGLLVSVLVIGSALGGAAADRLFVFRPLDALMGKRAGESMVGTGVEKQVVSEENAVTNVAEAASPSVVTVTVTQQQRVVSQNFFDPFSFLNQQQTGETKEVSQDIGTGFVVGKNMIVTNKHVVSLTGAEYKVIDKDDNEYKVSKIYRDPVNDLAMLQIEESSLQPLTLGDSNNLKVGQFVVAIGTALGEFRHTVTTGVVSGLGRGISAGDPLAGYVEQLDGVIQTDAAINPGNSGGPLLDYSGEVVGVNVAVAGNAQNVGFAIPINVVKESLDNFYKTGEFDRAQLGVRYRDISREAAVLNDLPQGALVVEVVDGSAAADAGINAGDIIVEIDGQKVSEIKDSIAEVVNKKRVGDEVKLKIWRNGEEKDLSVKLKASS